MPRILIWDKKEKEKERFEILNKPNQKDISISNPPIKPTLYGDLFKIKIYTDYSTSSKMSNVLHNISILGIEKIDASEDIKRFIDFYFNKMSKEFSAETLEKLSSDYNNQLEYYTITFNLNKNQTMEFMDLVERASQGVSI